MEIKLCCICLCFSKDLNNVCTVDTNTKSFLDKLRVLEPNQEWCEFFLMCPPCQILLNTSYSFRELCVNHEVDRKELFKQKSDHSVTEEVNVGVTSKLIVSDNEQEYLTGSDLPDDLINIPKIIDQVEDNEENYVCFYCNRTFKKKSFLARHISIQHGNTCECCSQKFSSKKKLQDHKKDKHIISSKYKKFQCQDCGESFSLLKEIIAHSVSTHNLDKKEVKPYWCTFCSSKFTSSTLLMQHKKYHVGERIFTCITCGKSFVTKRDLSGHEKLHKNQRKYNCDKCSKSFNTSQNLWTHIYVVHTDASEWKYSCTICSKKFAIKSNYNEHIKRHQGIKEHTCHICKKSFTTKPELQKHIKLHSNIAEWKCTQCQKTYRDQRSLKLHLSKAHSIGVIKETVRVKKFVCHICPSQFFCKNKLQRHIRTHTGVKPYECSECNKRFIDKSYLKYHLKNVHDDLKKEIL